METTFVRQITRVSTDQQKLDSYMKILPLKVNSGVNVSLKVIFIFTFLLYDVVLSCNQGRSSDTSVGESGSDADDSCCPSRKSSFTYQRLAPVREEVILLFHYIIGGQSC